MKLSIIATTGAVALILSSTGTQAENWESCLTEKSSAYIPSRTAVSEPAQETPVEFRRWSGAYIGYFGEGQNALCTRLFITAVKPDGVIEGVYVWGNHPRFGPGDERVRGAIDSETGKLAFSLSRGRVNSYMLSNDGNQVTGESKYMGKKTPVTMIRDSNTP